MTLVRPVGEAGDLGPATWDPVPSWPDPWTSAPVAAPQGRGRPLDYHQLLRGPRARWWKPPLSLVLVLALIGLSLIVVFAAGDLADAALNGRPLGSAFDEGLDLDGTAVLPELVLDLSLAALIPASVLATWVVHRVRPGFLSSVTGRLRWRWLVRCVLVLLPLWVVYLAATFLLDPPALGRPQQWVALLVLAVVVTPLQAAGEEYFFRGWLVQNVGVWFGNRVLGWVVSTVCSAALFALAHGSLDPWVLLDIGALAVAACYLNWRTGGLETGIALHVVNNVTVGIITITVGGYADSFVDTTTTGTPLTLAQSLLVLGIAIALLLWQLRRHPLQRTSLPAVTAA